MKHPLFLARVFGAIFISALELCVLSVGPISCSMGNGGFGENESYGGSVGSSASGSEGEGGLIIKSATPPVLRAFEVNAEDSMLLTFDKEVSVTEARLVPSTGGEAIDVSCESDGDGSVRLSFAEETRIGTSYDMQAVAHDADGNSLSFTITFDGFNARLPDLLICELRNAYSSKANKYEFVRLYCTKAGNLSGLELLSAGDGEAKAFAFPPVEVQQGDYVTVHLRKMKDEAGNWTQEGMVDEDSGDRRASRAVDSSDNAWDFWQDNQKSRLSPSDIVLLRGRTDRKVLDAFLFRDPKKDATDWDSKYAAFCRAVEQSGRWLDATGLPTSDYGSSFAAEGITSSAVTRTMKRRNLDWHPSSAADWEVVQAK